MRRFDHTLEPPRVVRRIEVISGGVGRRIWSSDDKARILDETLRPGAVVSVIARRHGLTPQQLFGWRRQARRRQAAAVEPSVRFVPAVIAAPALVPDPIAPPVPRHRRASSSIGIEVEIAGVVVRIGADAGVEAITAVIRALKAGS